MNARIEWAHTTGRGQILAIFDLYYGSFKINGFRVMKGSVDKGALWVAMPSKQIGPAGNRRHVSTVLVLDREKKEAFEAWVLKVYYKMKEGAND